MNKRRLISDTAVMILLIIIISLFEHHFAECTGSYICFYHDRNSETPAITINKLIEWQNKYSLKNIAFTSECRECTIKDMSVTPVLTNEYITNTELKLIHGSGITADNIANKNAVIIISEHLALSLFMTSDGIGRSIYMDNEEYTVCGVYRKPDNVLDRLCSDGKERLYIPYTSGGHKGFTNVDTISCSSGSVEAKRLLQMQEPQYFVLDNHERIKTIGTIRSVSVCLLLAYLWTMLLIGKKVTLQRSPIDFLRGNKHYLILYASIIAFTIITAVYGNLIFYIPPEYLPFSNIFDLHFYEDKLIETIQHENFTILTGELFTIRFYRFTLLIEIILFILLVLIITIETVLTVIYFIKNTKMEKNNSLVLK